MFEQALGGRFDTLPRATRAIHRPDPVSVFEGMVDVDGTRNRVGCLLAWLFGFPGDARGAALRVVIEATPDGSEIWSRVFRDRTMRSVMTRPDPDRGTVEEHFGGFRFRLRLDAHNDGLTLTPTAAWWRTARLPLWPLLRIAAAENAQGGRHLFDVTVSLPLIGRLVHYRGHLTPLESIA